MNKDNLTTLLGTGAGATILATIDFTKLGQLDRGEIAKIVVALLITALGYFTNKK